MTEPDLTELAWQEWPSVDPPFVQQWNQMALEIHRLKKELAEVRADRAALVSAVQQLAATWNVRGNGQPGM